MSEGYIQVDVDGSGKKVDNAAITVPAGTVVVGSDGTATTLTADAVYYRQRVVIGDPNSASGGASVTGSAGHGALTIDNASLPILESIDKTLQDIRFLITALQS